MAETAKDNNDVSVMMGVLDSDGTTPIRIKADPSTNILSTSEGSSGSDLGPSRSIRDNSGNPVLIAVSSDNGTTPVALYINSGGSLLIKAT